MKLNQIQWKSEIKKHVGYNIALLACALLAIFFLVMAIVAIASIRPNDGVAVKEAFDVSSSPLDAENQNFVSQVSGYLINYADQKAEVQKIILVVGNGRDRSEIELEGVTLYPRVNAPVLTSKRQWARAASLR